MRSTILTALILFLASLAKAGTIQPGLTVTQLAPPQAAGSTSENHLATAPNNDLWWSAGTVAYQTDGLGGWSTTVPYYQNQGGPIANNSVSSAIAFDAAGRMYINDFLSGQIFRTANSGATWEQFADLDRFLSDMRFDASGNLIAITQAADLNNPVSSIDANGNVSSLGNIHGLTFTIDANGDIIAPEHFGTAIYRLSGGLETTLFSYPVRTDPGPELWESIGLTPDGNYLIGVNLGTNATDNPNPGENFSKLIRIDAATGIQTVLGYNVGDSIPVDLQLNGGSLLIAGYGSLHPLELTGDLDAEFGPLSPGSVPEPSSWVVVLGLAIFCWRSFVTKRVVTLPSR